MEKRKVCGLWRKETKAGSTYFVSATLTQEMIDQLVPGEKLMIFENNYKENERQPDYQVFAAPPLQR